MFSNYCKTVAFHQDVWWVRSNVVERHNQSLWHSQSIILNVKYATWVIYKLITNLSLESSSIVLICNVPRMKIESSTPCVDSSIAWEVLSSTTRRDRIRKNPPGYKKYYKQLTSNNNTSTTYDIKYRSLP